MRNFLTKTWRQLGLFGQGSILFILLSSVIILTVTLSNRDAGSRRGAAPSPGRSAETSDARPLPEAAAAKENKEKEPRETISPTTPRSSAAGELSTTWQSSATIVPPRPMVPGSAVIRPPSFETSRCPFADPARRLATVSEEVIARVAPSVTSRIVRDNGGADRIFDPGSDLEVLEAQPGWVRLRRSPSRWPPGQTGWEGWAPEGVVRPAHRSAETMTDDEKACLFVDPAGWRGVTPALQDKIRETALRILSQDKRCRLIGDGGMMGESQRFYLTCYPSDGGQPYHYWLSAASSAKDFATPEPVDESVAMELCRKKLQKMLAGMGAVKGGPVPEVNAGAIRSFRERSAYYMTLDYRLGEAVDSQAYCFVPPGRDAEITLRDMP